MKSLSYGFLRWVAAVATLVVVAGCATTFTVDNTVQSFSQVGTLQTPATYRFERLPSQQAAHHAQLEAFADAALAGSGLRRDDANPRYSVQVNARVHPVVSPFADHYHDPWDRFGWGLGFGRSWGWHRGWGVGLGAHYGHRLEPPWYHREVDVVVRDLSNNRVVYESRAISEGGYLDNAAVLPAMFTAAMQGFPNPPAGPRRVNVQVAAQQTAAR